MHPFEFTKIRSRLEARIARYRKQIEETESELAFLAEREKAHYDALKSAVEHADGIRNKK